MDLYKQHSKDSSRLACAIEENSSNRAWQQYFDSKVNELLELAKYNYFRGYIGNARLCMNAVKKYHNTEIIELRDDVLAGIRNIRKYEREQVEAMDKLEDIQPSAVQGV